MKICKGTASYFQSYEHVEFDYSDLGSCLIGGETKAGKSTLMDLVPWVLFGTTSKDSSADDVRSWFADKEKTVGTLTLVLDSGEEFKVTRIRGKRSSENDLYFQTCELSPSDGGEYFSEPKRGKDATETQRLIEQQLGVTAELYMEAAYMHQFSRADSFFLAKAKDRRDVIEKIQDLSWPIKLAERSSEVRKAKKRRLEAVELERAKLQGKVDSLAAQRTQFLQSSQAWGKKHQDRIDALKAQAANFDADKEDRVSKIVDQLGILDQQIAEPETFKKKLDQVKKQLKAAESLKEQEKLLTADLKSLEQEAFAISREIKQLESVKGDACPTCLGPTDNPHRHGKLFALQNTLANFQASITPLKTKRDALLQGIDQITELQTAAAKINQDQAKNQILIERFESLRTKALAIKEEKNTYDEQVTRLLEEGNPYLDELERADVAIALVREDLDKKDEERAELIDQISGLTWLYDKSFDLKAAMLRDAVSQLEGRTNEILERHFDGEIRVQFAIEDGDKIEVTIFNSGFECPYKQLSGGERCMLKLAFGVAFLEAAQDTAGVHVSVIMLDEAFNGLNSAFKKRAFGLIEELSTRHESVLAIDHDEELKQMFARQFLVTKESSRSSVEEV